MSAYDSEAAAARWACGAPSPAEAKALDAIPSGSRVLDLGGGAGRAAVALRGRGCRVLGADAAPAMARVSGGVAARAEALPFRDRAFDAVAMLCLLHLLPAAGRRRTLAEALRVLVPGGWLVLSVLCPPPVPPLGGAYAPRPLRRALRAAGLAAVASANALTDAARGLGLGLGPRDMANAPGERAFFHHFTPAGLTDELLASGWGALRLAVDPPLPRGWRRRLPFPGLEARALVAVARRDL